MVRSIAQFVNVDASKAQAHFENTLVGHPRLLRMRDSMRLLHGRSIREDGVRALEGHILLVAGQSGSGKTFGLTQYKEAFPRVSREGIAAGDHSLDDLPEPARSRIEISDYWPVLFAEANKSTTNRGLAATLYEAYGYTAPSRWPMPVLLQKLKQAVFECSTEMIIVDEGHHIINHAKEEITEADVDFIKSISNQLRVQLVFSGLPRILDLGDAMQMHRRKEPDFVLEPYHWKSEHEIFEEIVLGFTRNMQIAGASNNASPDLVTRLFVASHGYVGLLSKQMSAALRRAIDRGLSNIPMLLHAEVYHDFLPEKASGPMRPNNWQREEDVRIATEDRARNPFLADDARVAAMIDAIDKCAFAFLDETAGPRGGSTKTGLRGKGPAPYSPLSGA